jgi:hypothetical protein
MSVVYCDGLYLCGLVWTFKFLPIKTQRPAYDMLGYLTVHFRDHCMVLYNDKG